MSLSRLPGLSLPGSPGSRGGGGLSTVTLTGVQGSFASDDAVAFDVTCFGGSDLSFPNSLDVTVDFGTPNGFSVFALSATLATTISLTGTANPGSGVELDLTAGAVTSVQLPSGFDLYFFSTPNLETVTIQGFSSSLLNVSITDAKLSSASVKDILDAAAASGGATTVNLAGGTSAAPPAPHAPVIGLTWAAWSESDWIVLLNPSNDETYGFYVDNGLGTPPTADHVISFGIDPGGDASLAATNLAICINLHPECGYTASSADNVNTITASSAAVLAASPDISATGNISVTSYDSGAYVSIQTILANGGAVTAN